MKRGPKHTGQQERSIHWESLQLPDTGFFLLGQSWVLS